MKRFVYPTYRDSGIEWLGEIPEHWETRRLKYASSVNDDVLVENTDPDFEMLYVDISSVDSVLGIQNKELIRFENAPSRARRQVRNGDVIISTCRTYLRAIAPIDEPEPNLTVSTGFAVIRPKNELDSRFASYALRASYFVDSIVARSVGVSYPAINASDLVKLRITLPPEPEQRTIAAFLDQETARIDALIAKKERQIELLQEKRTALISHAVTRGLNPDVKMKPSSIEWLGEIPKHWEIRKAKYCCSLNMGQSPTSEECNIDGEGLPFLQGCAEFGAISPNPRQYCDTARKVAAKGDILISVRAPVGALNIADQDYGIGRGLCSVRPRPDSIDAIFCWYLIHEMRSQLSFHATGSTYEAVAAEDVGNIQFVLLSLDEQRAIAAFLDRETARIDALIEKIQESIEKLREFRTALISAAVTGKIDVWGEVVA